MQLQPLPRQPLRDQVYAQLLNAIVSGDLAPGQRIRDHEIARQLGVSRTPIREALQRLDAEGLVETAPGAMTRVTPLAASQARDVFPVLGALHALASRLAIPKFEDRDIDEMRRHDNDVTRARSRGDLLALTEADTAFHGVPLRVAGNREILMAVEQLTPKVQRFIFVVFGRSSVRTPHVHREILAACRAKDAERAAHLVEQGWLSLGERLIRILEGAVDAGSDAPHRWGEDK